MRSSRTTEALVQPTGQDNSRELSAAWRGLNQTKAALRHIENRLEAAPGSGVQLDVVMDTKRSSSGATRKVSRRDGRRTDDPSHVGGASKARGRSRRSPDKSSRSPLRNTTQDGNVRRTNGVEFKEPLASYREAAAPFPPPPAVPATSVLPAVAASPPPRPLADPLSQLLYQSDTRDRQTEPDLDSTRSSALDGTAVRYLNDRPALNALRCPSPPAARVAWEAEDGRPGAPNRRPGSPGPSPSLAPPGPATETTPPPGPSSSSPGSASQRLENLRRRRPDDKLEKLKERIRRQREQLEGSADRERLLGYLERPVGGAAEAAASSSAMAKTRKVAAAPPAPMYRGFNSSQTMIRMPDGKVWKEEEFHNLSREIYRDLSRQLSESTRPQQQKERSRERKPSKPVRKVHKSASVPDPDTKPVISTTSWREGQKLVKMVLGPAPRVPRELPAQPADRPAQTARPARSSSDPRPESTHRSRPASSERPRHRGRSQAQAATAPPSAAPPAAATDILPADIRGILDDLQLERRAKEGDEDHPPAAPEEGGTAAGAARRRRRGSGSRTGPAAGGVSRSASPAKRQPEPVEAPPKKRHYDADSVRQYIARQQEERRRRQAEERQAQRDEAERRSQRLQELYRRQREGGAKGGPGSSSVVPAPGPEAPVQKRLQETYTKLLLEEAQLGEEMPPHSQPGAATQQQRPGYQPSGESDKENKRQERPLSASSSSDMSLSEPPLSRNDLGMAVPSWLQPDRLSPSVRPAGGSAVPPADRLLSQLLGLEPGGAAGRRDPPARPPPTQQQPALGLSGAASTSKLSRIEALKATAASLSTRIESEARKLAGAGVNYGAATAGDTDITLRPKASRPPADETHLATAAEADELALRIRKLLSAGRSAYDADLPGAGHLHSHQERGGVAAAGHASQRQEPGALTNGLGARRPEGFGRRRGNGNGGMENGEEEEEEGLRDSSGGSISEGLLLSEGSLSEGDPSPPHHAMGGRVPRPAERLEALDYCAGHGGANLQPLLSQFQREAERCPALAPPLVPRDGRTPWEELEKGSPHSVINIFTRNHLQGYAKVIEDRPERTSPAARSVQSAGGSGDAPVYEDDFVSSRSSGGSRLAGRSVNSHYEELMSRRSPYDPRAADPRSHHSSGSTPNSSPHSRNSAPASSPRSRGSAGKRDGASDRSDATLVEEQRTPCSPPSETPSADSKRRGSERSSALGLARSAYSDNTLGGASGHSPRSLGLDSRHSPASSPSRSPAGAPPPGPGSPPGAAQDGGSPPGTNSLARAPTTSAPGGRTENKATGELQYAPGVLHQRLSAELTYLESIEESVRQLGDVERLRGVSLAQQESVSLAQILKAQQLRHERDLYELKIKAEREALETQLQLEENRQRAARAQAELQGSLVQSQHVSLGGLQDAATKMISQQAEAARHTAEAARHIKEMSELARSQIAGALSVAAAPITSLYDQQRQQQHSFMKQLHTRTHTDSSRSEGSGSRSRPEEPLSSLDSLSRSDSLPSRRPNLSGGDRSSPLSPSQTTSSGPRERRKEASEERERGRKERGGVVVEGGSSSVEEEAPTAADHSLPCDSIPSLLDEKDSVSIATEYSLKFDESMTEDEIEERSFRSLLPSEAHRRGTLEKKPRPQEESEEEAANQDRTPGGQDSSRQQEGGGAGSMPFSGGQDSFSRFTMDMVRQYMKEEEVRAHHQSSLLRLRQKALKEKTRTELAWLEHQKRRLRDKGEDDKMPPIRKRQRGLLLKLQQEQAEIKRLQEASKAARRERQLLLKQQEDIERMRHSTLRLKERLKCAGDSPPESPMSETPAEGSASPSVALTDADGRSPSPLSVSGSETSSIMQKLKKMRSHMDEKFLTKREQQLMRRRRHAEELLDWKQRLDQEEAEVRRMEREALAAWDRRAPRGRDGESSGQHSPEHRAGGERGGVSEGDSSPVLTESSVHTEFSGSQLPASPSLSMAPPGSSPALHSPVSYTQEFDSASPSPSKRSPPPEASLSSAAQPEAGGGRMPLCSPSGTPGLPPAAHGPSASHTEPMSDQSDIESRIRALKEELRKRKSVVYQLKKEQKKRHKERLKAQEASLLKQLESYNDFIQKTKEELNKEPDATPSAKPQIKAPTSASEKPRIKPPPPHRSETSKSWKVVSDSEKSQPDWPLEHDDLTPSGRSRSTSIPDELSDEDPPTVTPTPLYGSPEHNHTLRGLLSPEALPMPSSREAQLQGGVSQKQGTEPGDESALSSRRSEVLEELETKGAEYESRSESLLKLDLEKRPASQQNQSKPDHVSSKTGECGLSPMSDLDVDDEAVKSGKSASNKSTSVATEPRGSERLDISSPGSNCSDIFSSKREAPAKAKEASPPSADGYHEDFESSVESSLREEDHHWGSKPTSPTSRPGTTGSGDRSKTRSPLYSSQEDEVEDMAEELSQHSGTTSSSHHSERMLDLQRQTRDPREGAKEKIVSPNRSPAISPSRTPPSPCPDEMPNFVIGDRVLVSGVQPGTLRFKGQTSFAHGFWAGVELDESEGSNNGTYDGVAYFQCEERHGIFAPPDKISRLPEKFEIYADATEDEDSFFDDLPDEEATRRSRADGASRRGFLKGQMAETSQRDSGSGDGGTDVGDGPVDRQNNLTSLKDKSRSDSNSADLKEQGGHPIPNGRSRNIILEFEDAPTSLYISDMDKIDWGKRSLKETTSLIDGKDLDGRRKPGVSESRDTEMLSAFADKLLNNFVKDAVKQFTHIKKAKDEKIAAANQMSEGEGGEEVAVIQKDDLPFFMDAAQEEVSSPELCNRPESPVLGASGQEELAKRLAELELSRELLDELGDEQDWFDEDFGLSSRREQQRQKQRLREVEEAAAAAAQGGAGVLGGGLGMMAPGEQQVKPPPRPELPLPPKLPEQPAMVVPHTASQVERLVHAATQEIWQGCGLAGGGVQTLVGLPVPTPSEEFLGRDAKGQDQEAVAVRSYRQAVYDLTWEIIQDIYAEDPNAHQPQWVKPRRVNSSYFHRVKAPGDITKVQEFISAEVLKLYGLKKDQNQKTDWQKMLKFGRKKRDRVDHILVQELHEEEAQWVNYDEDELFVKMQLADGIFDALVKDTAEVLSQIQESRSRRATLS